MTGPRETPHTESSPVPASRSTGSGSLPSSPSSNRLAIRAINPSPVKRDQPPTASTEPPPAPPAPPRASLNLAASNPSLPTPAMRHARSVSGTLSSLFGRRELAPQPDSPASDCATRASSPSPRPSPTSSASLPFSHNPTSPIKLNVGQRSTSSNPTRPSAAAPPSTSRDKATSTTAQLAHSSPAPPPPKVIAKRKRRFLLRLLWRRKKGGAGAQDGVAVPRSARGEELRELASGGGGVDEREDVAAWVSTIGSGASRAQGEVFGGDARSRPAGSEDDESSLGERGRTAGGAKAVAAVYYASLPTPYRCSLSFKHLHARMTTASSSTSLHRKKPLRHSPSSLRKIMNRPRPIERRTSTIGLFSFGHGFGHKVYDVRRSGEGRTAGGQANDCGEEEQREDDEASVELDDGDSEFEDVEPDLDHLARRRFTRSPAPSPASSRFLRSPPTTSRRLAVSPLSFGVSASIDTSQGRSSPVWYASSRARADPSSGTTPDDAFDRHSSFDTHRFDSLRATLSPASSRPTSLTGSTLSSASDASAQDLATAQIVVQAHSHARSSLEQQHERRRSSVGTIVTIVPRLQALEPVSPFKPRFEALGDGHAGDLREGGTAHEELGGPHAATTTPTATDPAGALAHLRSPAFRLDVGDPATLTALRRAGEDVFGSAASSAAAAARPAPLWDGEQRALGPPGSAAPGEGALEGAGPRSPGSPDSASTVRDATGAAEGGGSGAWKTGGEAARGARRVLGERQV
ncbi:hypothetical protein JCM9279_001958 [Rhodotorula babjevae]